MFAYCYKIFKSKIIALLAPVLRYFIPSQLACYKYCKPYFHNRIGFEIGGPSGVFKQTGILPVYKHAYKIDNCNFSHNTIWEGCIAGGATFRYNNQHSPGNQYIAEATNLFRIIDNSYDFLLASHTLEHIANPIKALFEWKRIIKIGGVIVIIVPQKTHTFDCKRQVSLLTHLVEDFEKQVSEEDLSHLDEILKFHDIEKDPGTLDFDSFKERSLKNFENRCLHHHVFDTLLAIEVMHYTNLQILAVEVFRSYDIVIIAQKVPKGQKIKNDQFRNINK